MSVIRWFHENNRLLLSTLIFIQNLKNIEFKGYKRLLFVYYKLLLSNAFISNARVKSAKIQANAKQDSETELSLFENCSYSSSALSSKNNRIYSKKWSEEKVCMYSWDMRLIIIKMKMKMKKRLHRYDINRPRSRHGHSYYKYKRSLSMIVLTCIKQYLSNIEAQFLQTLSKHWAWVDKKRCI